MVCLGWSEWQMDTKVWLMLDGVMEEAHLTLDISTAMW